MEKQEARVEKYIRYNIKDVQSIKFKEHSVSPMGVPRLKGYINNNEELDFIAHISTTKILKMILHVLENYMIITLKTRKICI